MLDKVPSCLMRVGHDGTLLAVSDAALTLLGANSLAEVLDTNFVARLQGEAVDALWAEFTARVSQSGSASIECEMTEQGDARRTVLLLGASLPAHPDAVPSLLIAVRDVSTARRLETSLHEQEQLRESMQEGLDNATSSLQELRTQLEGAATKRKELEEALSAETGRRQHVDHAFEQLTQALAAATAAAWLVRQALDSEKQ